MLGQKKIVLGVSASVAIYKACEVVRLLRKEGFEVRVALTQEAQKFISPVLFEALTSNKVYTDVLEELSIDNSNIAHIEWANWADAIAIVPATAHIMANLAYGFADSPVSLLALASDKPKIIAPAMNTKMYENPATIQNMQILKDRGFLFVEPTEGELACNTKGKGHIAQCTEIVEAIKSVFFEKILQGVTVITTAGGTQEAIDPVRFISNHSSGKMGFAIADMAAKLGANSILISGQTCLETPHNTLKINIKSAQDMINVLEEQILANKNSNLILIMAAAVADFKPKNISQTKIKRQNKQSLLLELEANPDISEYIKQKYPFIKLIGFAAETDKHLENAKAKIQKKGLEFIVLNDVSRADIGFGSDFNEVSIIFKDGMIKTLKKADKKAIAFNILKEIAQEVK